MGESHPEKGWGTKTAEEILGDIHKHIELMRYGPCTGPAHKWEQAYTMVDWVKVPGKRMCIYCGAYRIDSTPDAEGAVWDD